MIDRAPERAGSRVSLGVVLLLAFAASYADGQAFVCVASSGMPVAAALLGAAPAGSAVGSVLADRKSLYRVIRTRARLYASAANFEANAAALTPDAARARVSSIDLPRLNAVGGVAGAATVALASDHRSGNDQLSRLPALSLAVFAPLAAVGFLAAASAAPRRAPHAPSLPQES